MGNEDNNSLKSSGTFKSGKSSSSEVISSKSSHEEDQNIAQRNADGERLSNIFQLSGKVVNKFLDIISPKGTPNVSRSNSTIDTLNTQISSIRRSKNLFKNSSLDEPIIDR